MKHCPNLECPYRQESGTSAEYRDEARTCSDCGTALVVGEASPASAPERRPWERLAVTLLVPALVLVASRVPVPGLVETGRFPPDPFGTQALLVPGLTIFGLGLFPVLLGFVLVELAALVVPSWRAQRCGGPEARQPLEDLAYFVGLVATLIFATRAAFQLEALEFAANPGPAFRIVAALTLTAGVCTLVAGAWLVTRHGLGNGFAVILAASVVPPILTVFTGLWIRLGEQTLRPLTALVSVLPILAPVALALYFMRAEPGRHERDGRTTRPLRIPVAGVWPLVFATYVLLQVVGIAYRSGSALADTLAGVVPRSIFVFSLVALLTPPLAMAFRRPRWVLRALSGEPDSPSLFGPELRAATGRSVLFLGLAYGGMQVASYGAVNVLIYVPLLILATAAALDAVAEWRYRATRDDVVPAWSLQQVDDVDAALESASAAGIEAHARALRCRTLFQLLGPFVPIELLVLATQAEAARRLFEAQSSGEASASREPDSRLETQPDLLE